MIIIEIPEYVVTVLLVPVLFGSIAYILVWVRRALEEIE